MGKQTTYAATGWQSNYKNITTIKNKQTVRIDYEKHIITLKIINRWYGDAF